MVDRNTFVVTPACAATPTMPAAEVQATPTVPAAPDFLKAVTPLWLSPDEHHLFGKALEICNQGFDAILSSEDVALRAEDAEKVKRHYESLRQNDTCAIDVDWVERIPRCKISPLPALEGAGDHSDRSSVHSPGVNPYGAWSTSRKARKGANKGAWSAEEHRLFLLGLEEFGKGKARSIAQKYVLTRTTVQVASHPQKYFTRQERGNRNRRASVFDVTNIGHEASGDALEGSPGFIHVDTTNVHHEGGGDAREGSPGFIHVDTTNVHHEGGGDAREGSPCPITRQLSPSTMPTAGQPHAHDAGQHGGQIHALVHLR